MVRFFFELAHFCTMVHSLWSYFFMQHFVLFCVTFCENLYKVVCQQFSKDEFQSCLYNTLCMHEGLKKKISKLMFNE
jgi:hypothetical protein